jgi:DNA-binding LacI/PurR family transcriptional regulator
MLEVDERTGYRPNPVTKSFACAGRAVSMLTPDITSLFHSWLLRAVEQRANRCDHHVILCNTDDGRIAIVRSFERAAHSPGKRRLWERRLQPASLLLGWELAAIASH